MQSSNNNNHLPPLDTNAEAVMCPDNDPESYQNLMREKLVKDAIIDHVKAIYGHSHPNAHTWTVVLSNDPMQDLPWTAHVIVYTTQNSLRDWTILNTGASQPQITSLEALQTLLLFVQSGLHALIARRQQDAHVVEKGIGSGYARLG